jgi:hypothetical protein
MKPLVAIATAVLAATTMLSSAAEAGFGIRIGFGGGLPPYMTDYNRQSAYEHRSAKKRTYRAARQEKAPLKVTKKASKVESIAKTDSTEPAETENSSIAAAQPAEKENSSISVLETEASKEAAAEPVKTAVATPCGPQKTQAIDCKKFFASVGMTLTVPCE